jgi:type I phosphodiesterase/nucleotide pyrophosphatase
MTLIRLFVVALLLVVSLRDDSMRAAQPAPRKLILITLDGARVEEIFGGLDRTALQSTLRGDQKLEEHPAYRRFWAASPEERRQKLMPFFWATLMREHGSIAGNVRVGSSVTLTNRHRFSYPGYAEILLGEAHDDVIASNDPGRNPFVTVLEELKRSLRLPRSGVGVFSSWDVFSAIVEHEEGALTINDGFRVFEHPGAEVRQLNELQFHTQTPWDAVRHDVYTFRFAMAHLRTARPQVMYIALGETDDWAHDGRYDRVLEAYARTDEYLRELWTWLQQDEEYRGRTHILLTTDHGRGRTAKDWRNHGEDVDGAQDVWIAFVSPDMPRRGEWRDHAPLRSNQIAATLALWMGLDWNALRPAAGSAIR